MSRRPNPAPVLGINTAVQMSMKRDHVCIVLADTQVKCWGRGENGQLGNNAKAHSEIPLTVHSGKDDPSPLTGAIQVSAGEAQSCAVLSDGTARCWGLQYSGRLGNGVRSRSDQPYPAAVQKSGGGDLDSLVAINTGRDHSCAITSDGHVYCWGRGSIGRLGTGGSSDQDQAVRVETAANTPLDNVVQVALGREHTCALKSNGQVFCWGKNSVGELGDNSRNVKNRPVAVHAGKDITTPLEGAIQISAGRRSSCALLSSGLLKCWGRVKSVPGNFSNDKVKYAPYPVVTSGGIRHSNLYRMSPALSSYGQSISGTANRLNPIRFELSSANPSPNSSVDAPVIEVSGIESDQTVKLYSDSTCETRWEATSPAMAISRQAP